MGRTRWTLLGLAAAAACSPVFNWREVPVSDDGLVALLPCKPDRAERPVRFGSQSLTLSMAGCEAGGATFAVAQAQAADAAQAQVWLAAWQQASRDQWPGADVRQSAPAVPRAAAQPPPAELALSLPAAADRPAAQAHMLWFAYPGAGGMVLAQATVLGQPSSNEAVQTFFEGLRPP